MRRQTAAAVVLACALLHLVPGLALGLLDGGDYSLLVVGGPLAAVTGAAGLLLLRPALPWATTGAVTLTAVVAALAVGLVGVYALGVLHAPQALVAVVVAARLRAERYGRPRAGATSPH